MASEAFFPSQSVAVDNPIDPESTPTPTQTTAQATTPTNAFVMQHMHPPSAVPGYLGMPTNDSRSQVTIRWVQYGIVDSSSYLSTAPATVTPVNPGDISGYAFLTTSGVNHSTYTFVKFIQPVTHRDTWRQDINNTKPLDVYDVTRMSLDATVYRPTYKSVTTYLNATAFNDVGIVTTAQYNPPLLFAGQIESLAADKPQLFLKLLKCHSSYGHPIALDKFLLEPKFLQKCEETVAEGLKTYRAGLKELEDELASLIEWPKDRQDADRIRQIKKTLEAHAQIKPVTLDPSTSIQFADFGNSGNDISGNQSGAVVPTTDQVMNLSTRSYGGKALDGCFTVSRLNTIAPSWKVVGPIRNGTAAGLGLFFCYFTFRDNNGIDDVKPFLSGSGRVELVPGAYLCEDAQWSSDQTWTWTVYDGIAPNPIASAATTRVIAIKQYIGLELQPAAKSPWAGSQKLSPRPSLSAMQRLLEAYFDMKDGTAAKYNFLGNMTAFANVAQKNSFDIVGRAINMLDKVAPRKEVEIAEVDKIFAPAQQQSRRQRQPRPTPALPAPGPQRQIVGPFIIPAARPKRARSASRRRARSRPSRSRTRRRSRSASRSTSRRRSSSRGIPLDQYMAQMQPFRRM